MATKTIKEDSLTLSVGQAAHILGISNFLAHRLVRTGEIPSIRLGKIIRVPKAKLLKMINNDQTCEIGGAAI